MEFKQTNIPKKHRSKYRVHSSGAVTTNGGAVTTNGGISSEQMSYFSNIQNWFKTDIESGGLSILAETNMGFKGLKFNKTLVYSPEVEDDLLNIRRYGANHTLINVMSPPQTAWGGAKETTLALVRGDNNEYFMDIYNMDYGNSPVGNFLDYGNPEMGIRIQKRGSGSYTPFYIEYGDGTNVIKALEITPRTTSGSSNDTMVNITNHLTVKGKEVWHSGNSNLNTIDWTTRELISNRLRIPSGEPTHLSNNQWYLFASEIGWSGEIPSEGSAGMNYLYQLLDTNLSQNNPTAGKVLYSNGSSWIDKLLVKADISDFPTTWSWSNITGIPTSFIPITHSHTKEDITDLPTWVKQTYKPTYKLYEITDTFLSQVIPPYGRVLFSNGNSWIDKQLSTSDISNFPSSLPASDVYSWAKASTKPTYTAEEIGALSIYGGNISGNLAVTGNVTMVENINTRLRIPKITGSPTGLTLGQYYIYIKE